MRLISRHTVLFPNAEDVGSHLTYNDTHIEIRGDAGVIAQNRWAWNTETLDNGASRSSTRITWRAPERVRGDSESSVAIEPVLCPGLNIYTNATEKHECLRMVENPVYQSVHKESFTQMADWLPSEYDTSFIKWDEVNCDYDITILNKTLEINEWCPIENEKVIEFTKPIYVNQSEVGLFYVDFHDDKDINLGGLRCTWDSVGVIENCQKTMLMYMPAHVVATTPMSIHLEKPVGLHPNLVINLENYTSCEIQCDYFAYLQLPVDLFIDRFQSGPVSIFGQQDLEQPEYRLQNNSWGSESLFILEAGKINEINLHSRYVSPAPNSSYKSVAFNAMIFKACDSNTEEVVRNPFYSKGLGYEAFFTPDTVFNHMRSTSIGVDIPVVDTSHYNTTRFATLGCIIFSMIYLFLRVFTKR